ncbi:hypothetical protein [Otariodibacter sp.]|uniref:hypothetical protein n=1 Tax=Otariodibacter sp. TaxID=3030919 RepID=UPI002610E765|nr:hypothetical protein [Otariodibacter sp.]
MEIIYINCTNEELLKDSNDEIITHKFSNLPFRLQRIVLKNNNKYSVNIINKVKERIKNMKFNVADSSGKERCLKDVHLKSFCGMIAEQLCYEILNFYNQNDNVDITLDDSNSSINQIDLRVLKKWKDNKSIEQSVERTIEVRSSFPFCSIEKAIAKNFDILGYYTNNIKKIEIEKDFYLRFLFKLDYNKSDFIINKNGSIDYSATTVNILSKHYFDEKFDLKKELYIYFIGGVTKHMMLDDSIAYDGSMNSINFNQNNSGKYRKVKARNALDCISIIQLILNVITNEAEEGK